MAEIRFDRLLALAEHLESGKLGHDRFCFAVFHETNLASLPEEVTLPEDFCGSVGCACGELPFLHPGVWEITKARSGYFTVRLVGSEEGNSEWSDIRSFFGLDSRQALHLFNYSDDEEVNQRVVEFGGEELGPNATRRDVAANIRAFVEKMREGTLDPQGGSQ